MIRLTGKFFMMLGFLVITTSVIAPRAIAKLSVTVDRTQITEADLLRLSIRIDKAVATSNPNFSPLQKDFAILGTSGPNQSSRISIVNGRQTSEVYTAWELRLRAKRLGRLTIPSFKIGNERSRPITIEVVRQTAAMKRKMNQLVFFETSVDSNEIYVQGQIIYTIKLFYVESIAGDFPESPDLGDAVVETIESERRYDTITNGRRYYVLEKRYAIYPQGSGELLIPRQTFSGSNVGRGLFSTREPILVHSEAHRVTVNPRPASFPGDNWLPARALEITESWSELPVKFKVGEPVNRTLTITVNGLASSLLPPFQNTEIEGTKTYKDPAVEDQITNENGIIATRSVTIGIVPTRSGPMTIPEIQIPWWNTTTNKQEVATVPSTRFEVEATTEIQMPSPTVTIRPEASKSVGTSTQPLTVVQSGRWMVVSIILSLLWVVTLFLWWRQYHRSSIETAQKPETNNSAASENDLYKSLIKACGNNEASSASKLLFLWGKARYPSIESTRALARTCACEHLVEEINALETSLYSTNTSNQWRGANLANLVAQIKQGNATQKREPALLGSLNPV